MRTPAGGGAEVSVAAHTCPRGCGREVSSHHAKMASGRCARRTWRACSLLCTVYQQHTGATNLDLQSRWRCRLLPRTRATHRRKQDLDQAHHVECGCFRDGDGVGKPRLRCGAVGLPVQRLGQAECLEEGAVCAQGLRAGCAQGWLCGHVQPLGRMRSLAHGCMCPEALQRCRHQPRACVPSRSSP